MSLQKSYIVKIKNIENKLGMCFNNCASPCDSYHQAGEDKIGTCSFVMLQGVITVFKLRRVDTDHTCACTCRRDTIQTRTAVVCTRACSVKNEYCSIVNVLVSCYTHFTCTVVVCEWIEPFLITHCFLS